MAGFITEQLSHSVGIVSTLQSQLVKENRDVIVHVEPGASVGPDPKDPLRTRRFAEEVYRDGLRLIGAHAFRQAHARFENALQLYEHLEDLQHIAECFGQLGFCASNEGMFEQALRYADRAQALFEQLEDHTSTAKALLLAGNVLHHQGLETAAIERFERAVAFAQAGGAGAVEASAEGNIGAALAATGDHKAAIMRSERALALKREHADAGAQVGTLINLASLYQKAGDSEKSRQILVEAQQIAQTAGDEKSVTSNGVRRGF